MSKKSCLRVTVIGAGGGIGQPLSLLLKLNATGLISHLNLYDLVHTPGIAADLAHIPTCTVVKGFLGPDQLHEALRDADVVVIPAGVPRKPGMSRDDLFSINAGMSVDLATACAKTCPNAVYLVISNPVNSLVPVWAKALEKAGAYNPKKLFGITTLDTYRANTFAGEKAGTPVEVPVVGGHSGATIVPLFSLAKPSVKFSEDELKKVTHRVAFGGDEVVEAKQGNGSATLSMASAGAKFVESMLKALAGVDTPKEVAYIECEDAMKRFGTRFFATEVCLGPDGVSKIHDTYSKANEYEQGLIQAMIGDLKAQIKKGEDFTPQPKLE